MKRFILFLIPALLIAGNLGCSDEGGKMPFLGFGSSDVENSAVPVKHMEYYYNDDTGKRLNDMAVSGIPDSEDFRARLNDYMSAPLVRHLGESDEDPASVNWWERYDVDADGIAEFLNSANGVLLLKEYYGVEGGTVMYTPASVMTAMPRSSVADEVDGIREGLKLLKDMPVLMTQATYGIAWIFSQMNAINNKLDYMQQSINDGFEMTLFRLDEIEEWLKIQPFVEASNAVTAKIESFVNMDGYDFIYRRDLIKEYFTSQHEVYFQQAYASAVDFTNFMNTREAIEKVPGNMLLSHMVVMRQMSELRLAYAPVFYTGNNLLRFRANWARSDLKRLKEIKDSLLSEDNPAGNVEYFNEACALLASWEIELRSHIEVYYGGNPTQVRLEEPENVDDDHAFGNFGDLNDVNNVGTCGEMLTDGAGAPLIGLFAYGDSLESVFDEGTSGDLAPGRFIRLVHSGKNLLADLGLVPVAKSLVSAADMGPAPGKGEFFIDPALGRYILPRPDYWSLCESDESMRSPVIYNAAASPSISMAGAVFADGKFGAAWGKYSGVWDESFTTLLPFGNDIAEFSQEGSLSVWWKTSAWGQNLNKMKINITNDTYVLTQFNINGGVSVAEIYAGGASPVSSSVTGVIINETWNHVYVIWDNDGFEIDGSMRIKVYVNGNLVVFTNVGITGGGPLAVGVQSGCNIGGGYSAIDNLKIWNHVVTEDPSFEWKGGAGRENALHPIYGPDDDPEYDYRPKLIGPDGGVGYYYLP